MKCGLFLIACILVLSACTKESDYQVPNEVIYTVKKNAFRAVKVSGTSAYWGKFTLNLTYDKDELDKGVRINEQNDTVGDISLERGNGYIKYSIRDYIPSVDKDSINRLEAELTAKYGFGHYNLWDSVPKTSRTVLAAMLYLYTDGRIKKIVTQKYRPNENIHATGEEFDNSYILVSTDANTYEYNINSDICIERMMKDVHNSQDKDLYERFIYKNEILYENEMIVSLVSYTAKGGEDYSELNRYTYTYDKNHISMISGRGFMRKFGYDGRRISIETNGNNVFVEVDQYGNTVSYDDEKGNHYRIEYEKGSGNLSIFTPLDEQMKNPYYIR